MSLSNEATISAWFNRQIDNQLLTAGEDGLVALWEIQGEALRQIRVYRHADEAIGFARFSADGARIMAVDASNSVFIWDTATGEVLGSIENRPLDGTSVIDPSMHKPTEPVPDISADDIQAARTCIHETTNGSRHKKWK